jgi:hypothetical protein
MAFCRVLPNTFMCVLRGGPVCGCYKPIRVGPYGPEGCRKVIRDGREAFLSEEATPPPCAVPPGLHADRCGWTPAAPSCCSSCPGGLRGGTRCDVV